MTPREEEMAAVRYPDFVSDEPLSIIFANECTADIASLCTKRFRRVANEYYSAVSQRDELVAVVEKCRDQFRFYTA